MRSSSHRPAPPRESDPLPSTRFLGRRRAILLRDWILALIALGLVLAASALRSGSDDPAPVAAAHAARDI
jgi:hypothetical protein